MQPDPENAFAKLSDEALMRLVVMRRSEALGALYDRYGRLVFSLALQVVRDRETAEEVAQDVFSSFGRMQPLSARNRPS